MSKMQTLRTRLEPLIEGIEKDIKDIQLQISSHIDAPRLNEELNRLTDRLVFLREQWTDAEKAGTLDRTIYERGSIEYYRQNLEGKVKYLDSRIIAITQSVLEENTLKPSQKIKMLKNLMKVYEELNQDT